MNATLRGGTRDLAFARPEPPRPAGRSSAVDPASTGSDPRLLRNLKTGDRSGGPTDCRGVSTVGSAVDIEHDGMADPPVTTSADEHVTVSVVLCTYQGERWLGPLLDSILGQGRRPDEMVVQDDGSTDGTVALVEAVAEIAPFPIAIEVNDRRLGPTRNFERALGRSSGGLIVLADQDDRWHPTKLARLTELLEEDPGVALAFTDADLIDEDDRTPARAGSWKARSPKTLWEARGQRRFLRRHPVIDSTAIGRRPISTGCTMAFRRRVLSAALPFPGILEESAAPMGHDRWLGIVATTMGTVLALDERQMAFRVHEAQATGLPSSAVRNRGLRSATIEAIVGRTDFSDRANLVQAQQLEAAAERGERAGDFVAADALRGLARHHRFRSSWTEPLLARMARIIAEARAGGYGHDRTAARRVAADLTRAIGRHRTSGRRA